MSTFFANKKAEYVKGLAFIVSFVQTVADQIMEGTRDISTGAQLDDPSDAVPLPELDDDSDESNDQQEQVLMAVAHVLRAVVHYKGADKTQIAAQKQMSQIAYIMKELEDHEQLEFLGVIAEHLLMIFNQIRLLVDDAVQQDDAKLVEALKVLKQPVDHRESEYLAIQVLPTSIWTAAVNAEMSRTLSRMNDGMVSNDEVEGEQ